MRVLLLGILAFIMLIIPACSKQARNDKYLFVGIGNNIRRDTELNQYLRKNTILDFKVPEERKKDFSKFSYDLFYGINSYQFADSMEAFSYRREKVKKWMDDNSVRYIEKPIYYLYFLDKKSITHVPILHPIGENKREQVDALMYYIICIVTEDVKDTLRYINLCNNSDSMLILRDQDYDAAVYIVKNMYYVCKRDVPIGTVYYPYRFKPSVSGTLCETLVDFAKQHKVE